MTIRKGEPWGEPVERPADLRVLGSDAEVAAAVSADPTASIGLSGGDLHRSVGSPPARTTMQRLPIDALAVSADGEEFLAVAHVVVRRGWWRGPIVVAMNVDHLGDWNVAPRAHPNDGRVDLVEVEPSMTLRERWQARGRLAAGTHVPHPKISVRTGVEATWKFSEPQGVWVDGVRAIEARAVSIAVRPDAFTVVV